jgi:hypothetical protein
VDDVDDSALELAVASGIDWAVCFWVWGALVALGVGIGRASGTNYFTARRRLFFTSGREHALISSIGDSNRRNERKHQ